MQGAIGSVRHRDQMIDAERLATSVTVELVTARAKQRAACWIRARGHFEDRHANTVLIRVERQTVEGRAAVGAFGGNEAFV
jgi:hypothetical protein